MIALFHLIDLSLSIYLATCLIRANSRIDYIMASKNLPWKPIRAVRSNSVASDHYLISVEFTPRSSKTSTPIGNGNQSKAKEDDTNNNNNNNPNNDQDTSNSQEVL